MGQYVAVSLPDWDLSLYPLADGESVWAALWEVQLLEMPDERARSLARAQGFVATRKQLRRCGYLDAELRREVRAGRWHVPHHGVLALLPWRADNESALRATAAALVRPGHVISHRSAAVLRELPALDLPGREPLRAELTAPGTRRSRLDQLARVRTARIPDEHREHWFGVPVTSLPRTVVDLARVDRQVGIVAMDAALRGGLVTREALVAQAAVHHPGAPTAQALVALASAQVESPLESLARLLIHDAGLPAPVLQHRIKLRNGRSAFVDLYWPQARLIVEVDGRSKYSDTSVLWREKKREDQLRELGYTVIRPVWADVVHAPVETIARLAAALHIIRP